MPFKITNLLLCNCLHDYIYRIFVNGEGLEDDDAR